MEESEEPAANRNTPSPCEECGSNPWKYRCPGCSIRTCSLPCVKAHKLRTSCTGHKGHSEVVPLSKFDDNLLLSDYHFLEEAKRVAETARRMRDGIGCHYYKLPMKLKVLRGAAYRRRMRLLLLPYGMSRRAKNQSRYDKRNNAIFWTIEWRFHPMNIVLVDHGVDDRMNICTMVEKHLTDSPWNHQLRPFCNEQIDNLKFFIQKNPKGTKAIFRELKVRDPIGQQMAGILIVEYPIIHVYLPSDSYPFEIENVIRSSSTHQKPSETKAGSPSPKGIVFREEDIEDDGSSDTQVLDLMHYPNTNGMKFATTGKDVATSAAKMHRTFDEASKSSLGNTRQTYEEKVDRLPGIETNSLMDCNFDFEQDLKDAYSDLIGGLNPDDFLCLDGIFSDGETAATQVNLLNFGGDPLEELEEGEIPTY